MAKELNETAEAGGFAERLEVIREHYGLKGNTFADRLGLPYRSYMNYKTGRTPPAELLVKVIQEFSVSPLWLMTGSGPIWQEAATDAPQELPNQAYLAGELPDFPLDDEAAWLAADKFAASPTPQAVPGSPDTPDAVQWRLMRNLLDLHEENRQLRAQVTELERHIRALLMKVHRLSRR